MQRRFNKKSRFHLLSEFILQNFNPCKVLDVGGGKGVLSYLLNQNGFYSTVCDPEYQELPNKFRVSHRDKSMGRYLIKGDEKRSVEHITEEFDVSMVNDFDLIVSLHGHGCMYPIIEQCALEAKPFVILPCCVIGEPVEKQYGINWDEQVFNAAKERFDDVGKTNLNFVGNNMTIFRK